MRNIFNTTIFLIIWAFLIFVQNVSAASESVCDIEAAVLKKLNSDQLKLLREKKFLSHKQLFISADFVPDCELRYYASSYISSKMNNADAIVHKAYVRKHKCEISDISLAATDFTGWDGGAFHEVFNVASEELMPCWAERATLKMARYGIINLDLFTKSMFLNPSQSILDMTELRLKSDKIDLIEAGQLLFILKNGGRLGKIPDLKKYSEEYLISPGATVRKDLKRMLKKSGKISLAAAWDFSGHGEP